MSKLSYLFGLLKHFLNTRISKMALVDASSTIDKTARICHHSKVYHSKVGAYTYVAPRTHLVHVNIGKFCSVASDCSVGLASHSMNNISTSPIFTAKKNATKYQWVNDTTYNAVKNVSIGNDVWIGTKVIIMGGIKIGNGAIIGAGSIVTKDIPDYAIAVGVPAKVVKYRFDKPVIEKLLKLSWWNFPEQILKKNIDLFKKEHITVDDLQEVIDDN